MNPGVSLEFSMSHRWAERSFYESRPFSLQVQKHKPDWPGQKSKIAPRSRDKMGHRCVWIEGLECGWLWSLHLLSLLSSRLVLFPGNWSPRGNHRVFSNPKLMFIQFNNTFFPIVSAKSCGWLPDVYLDLMFILNQSLCPREHSVLIGQTWVTCSWVGEASPT